MTGKTQRLPLRHPEQGKGFSHPADRCTPRRAWKGGFVDRVAAPAPQFLKCLCHLLLSRAAPSVGTLLS